MRRERSRTASIPTPSPACVALRRVRLPAEARSFAGVVEESVAILVQPIGLILICALELLVLLLLWRGSW